MIKTLTLSMVQKQWMKGKKNSKINKNNLIKFKEKHSNSKNG